MRQPKPWLLAALLAGLAVLACNLTGSGTGAPQATASNPPAAASVTSPPAPPASAVPATAAASETPPPAPSATPAPTETATEPPTATALPVVPAIAPENLAQLRERWAAEFPGDFEVEIGCNAKDKRCPQTSRLTGYAFSPDGGTLAAAACSGTLYHDRTQPAQDDWSCDGEAAIRLYDSASGAERARLAPAAMPLALAFQPGSHILAAGLANSTIELWDTETGQLTATLDGDPKFVGLNHVAYTADGGVLVSGSDLQLQVWDGHTGQLLNTLPRSVGLGLSAAGDRLVTLQLPAGRGANVIRLYDLPRAEHFSELAPDPQGPAPTFFMFNPKNGWLATVDYANSAWVQFWDLATGSVVARLDFTQEYDALGVLYGRVGVFTADGYYLLSRSGKLTAPEAQPAVTGLADSLYGCGFALLDLEAGRTFFGPALPYDVCAAPPYDYDMAGAALNLLSPDGRLIASADTFGRLRVWGVDPSVPVAAPQCSGNCPAP